MRKQLRVETNEPSVQVKRVQLNSPMGAVRLATPHSRQAAEVKNVGFVWELAEKRQFSEK
ncbi:hypothetical protein ACFVAV_20200 [Nocardia sp. NPDC057663]|uniref:hypothetical protein n=1 Tax=Nocardia sp. NPDC057663 TaxID=3346201 RepID=UPI00366CDFDF